ncbi:MAG: ATP-binding protein [Candidatus Eremiobacteraeota bacterium]|nr:ATP-binding protein [Candidatus Eremiobacteraeota bacterium]
MTVQGIPTQFAPAERGTPETLRHQAESILKVSLIRRILDVIPDFVLILNSRRQIAFVNRSFLDFLGEKEGEALLGKRQGEALKCIHADAAPGGCGTTEFCEMCGAVNAILASQKGELCASECTILLKEGGAAELRVWAAPFDIEDESYTIFSMVDRSGEKRRRNLERIFFHDVLNTAGGLYGFADLLMENLGQKDDAGFFARTIFDLSGSIIEEIRAQKDLSAAEGGDLVPRPGPVDSLALISEVAKGYKEHEVTKNKTLEVAPDSQEVVHKTDRTLLRRVISNLVKNALEASKPGEKVTLRSALQGNEVLYTVHNPAYMPREVQLQLFNRSFTTKGAGRGLGTYSIKLLTEKYLKGSVTYTSLPESGTTFYTLFPMSLGEDGPEPLKG